MVVILISMMAAFSLGGAEEQMRPLLLGGGLVEQGLRVADSAFIAQLEWYVVESSNENESVASGLILPIRALWGTVPAARIDIGRQYFAHCGSKAWSLWKDFCPREGMRIPIVLLSVGSDDDFGIVHVVHSLNHNDVERLARDLLIIKNLEFRPDSRWLREQLIALVIDVESSDLAWQYALRRLNHLEDDEDARFRLVLHPRIQQSRPHPGEKPPVLGNARLAYAIDLLTGVERGRPEDAHRQYILEEQRATFFRLLEAFEKAPSPYMAQASLGRLCNRACWIEELTDAEWERIRGRIQSVLDDPEHAIHRVAPENRQSVNLSLEHLFDKPDLLPRSFFHE